MNLRVVTHASTVPGGSWDGARHADISMSGWAGGLASTGSANVIVVGAKYAEIRLSGWASGSASTGSAYIMIVGAKHPGVIPGLLANVMPGCFALTIVVRIGII